MATLLVKKKKILNDINDFLNRRKYNSVNLYTMLNIKFVVMHFSCQFEAPTGGF